MKCWILVLLIGSALVLGVPQAEAGDPTWLVFDVEVRGLKLPKRTVENMSEYLVVRLAERGLRVVPREERMALMASRKIRACAGAACRDELAKGLGADRILTTRVLKMLKTCKVTAQLNRLGQVVPIRAASAGEGCAEKELLRAFDELVFRLAYLGDSETETADESPKKSSDSSVQPKEDEKAGTGSLSLTSRPVGRVWIDGQDSGRDTPLVDFPLSAGKHQLTIRSGTGLVMRAAVEIWPDESTSLTMASDDPDSDKAYGWLAVNTRPWSEVSIDGKHVGMTPLRQRLPVGKHEVRVAFPHGETKTKVTQIERGRTSRLVVDAEADRGAQFAPGVGLLKLNSSPWGRVWINGKDVGKATPLFHASLKEGKHRVTIYFSTGGFMTEEVQIRAGEVTRKIIREKQP